MNDPRRAPQVPHLFLFGPQRARTVPPPGAHVVIDWPAALESILETLERRR